jgi:hypothetical protein
MRDEFTPATVKRIAQKAMWVCANGSCLRVTGYATAEGDARTVADAAHILPAGTKGPRATKAKNPRSDESNGIWLCKICHKKVDDDPHSYPEDLLHYWKQEHEIVVRRIVGKDLEYALLELRNARRYTSECREVLAFFDSKRIFYEALDADFPARVLESVEIIRQRISDVRGRISPESELFYVLRLLQDSCHEFLRKIGPRTDLNELRCDAGDPDWRNFADELSRFRRQMNLLLRPMSDSAGLRLSWLDPDDQG